MWEQDPSYLSTARKEYISTDTSVIKDTECSGNYTQRSSLNTRFPNAYGQADLWMTKNLPKCQKFVFDYDSFFSCVGKLDSNYALTLNKDDQTGIRPRLTKDEIYQGLKQVHATTLRACEQRFAGKETIEDLHNK